jgi:hypothetical protein
MLSEAIGAIQNTVGVEAPMQSSQQVGSGQIANQVTGHTVGGSDASGSTPESGHPSRNTCTNAQVLRLS